MAHDERDEVFERGLARHLRAEAERGSAMSSASSDATKAGSACLDAETLAAMEEGLSLSAEERRVAEEHLAVCSRCRGILQELKVTRDLGMSAAEENVLPAGEGAAAVTAIGGTRGAARENEFAKALRGKKDSLRTDASRAPSEISRGRSKRKWIAPAGAIAAGLIMWVVVREWRQDSVTPTARTQIAEKRAEPEAGAPLPAVTRLGNSQTMDEKTNPPARFEPQKSQNGVADDGKRSANAKRSEYGDSLPAPKPLSAATDRLEKKPTDLALNGRSVGNESLLNKEEMEARAQSAVPAAPSQTPSAQAQAPSATPQPSSASTSGPVNGAVTNEMAPVEEPGSDGARWDVDGKKAKAGTIGKLNQRVEVDASAAKRKNEQKKIFASKSRAGGVKIIAAPEDGVLWRVGRVGAVERSVDRGVTWKRQNSGVNEDLLGGSAPDGKVCWIIGASGTLLRTTDGGESWAKLKWPIEAGAGEVRAADAMHASIADVNARERFMTSDGGVTWVRVGSEQ
ncbi:MAG: hypothetical protein M3N22_05010 [Acidobacteriota bacterium]|nr:hypothetical protein [Acidobacteriota bacterium]